MKTIENKKLDFKGIQLTDESKTPLDVIKVIRVVLENSAYDNAGALMKAVKVEAKLKEEDGNIILDDADFEFIKKWALVYTPLLQKGLMFAEFYKQLE